MRNAPPQDTELQPVARQEVAPTSTAGHSEGNALPARAWGRI